MEEVGLRSLSHFAPLPCLQALFLGGNRVAELLEVDRLSPLPALAGSSSPTTLARASRSTARRRCAS